MCFVFFFFFSSRRRHTRCSRDWSSDVCSSDLLSDRLGSRGVTVAGGVLLGTGLVLSSQATALWQLNVTFGVAVGFAAGAFLAPLSATATKWFTANRGLAVGVVSAGGGAGMLLLSPLTRWLTSLY